MNTPIRRPILPPQRAAYGLTPRAYRLLRVGRGLVTWACISTLITLLAVIIAVWFTYAGVQ